MLARIFRPTKTAMQSGRARTRFWELAFEPASARTPEPLMGWTVTADTQGQVRLRFETCAEAVAYAERNGIPFEVLADSDRKVPVKAYADNFAFRRKQPWTH